ncbi:MAG: hypothetical protein JKY56_04525, partial [Kofleriaceae bacterium]|nr:hypothetical protein [Kofleriaceae bacterium]
MSWPRFFILFTALFLASSRQLAEAQNVPRPLSSWVLKGVLIDDEETIRSFLRPLIQKSENWSSEDQRKIKNFLLEFGYHSEITNNDIADGSVRATIRIKPATLVRYIKVQLNIGILERLYQPIFANELARKMSIRPGSPLAESAAKRKLQLDAEGERIRQYLVDDGFFEAKVTVESKSKGPFEVLVTAHVDPGPPYFLKEKDIQITGNAAIRSEDIRPGFKHPRICLILDICGGEQRFSRKQLRADLRALVQRYKNQEGFPGVRIHDDYDPRHSFDRVTRTV